MITNQVMKRPMGNFLVEQRTKDSMFNATTCSNSGTSSLRTTKKMPRNLGMLRKICTYDFVYIS